MMRLDVTCDPARPDGGYARLATDATALPEGEAVVSVFDAFSERYLGRNGWQSEPAGFGPYPVRHEGSDAALVIGPEIVNQLEEYAALRITVGALEAEVSWPDDVVPMPGAARIGGLQVAHPSGPAPSRPPVTLSGPPRPDREPDPGPAPLPETPPPTEAHETPEPAADEPAEPTRVLPAADLEPAQDATVVLPAQPEKPARRLLGYLLLALLLALLAAGGADYYYNGRSAGTAAVAPATPTPAAAPAPDNDCSRDTIDLAALGDFSRAQRVLETCADRIAPPRALAIIENAAAAGDADALELFGQLYDAGIDDSPIETAIGLHLPESAAKAAEYYARARDAGSSRAEIRLVTLCTELRTASDTLSQNAVEEYCSQ